MKKILILFLMLGTTVLLSAQEDNEIETLFSKPSKVRGYIGPLTNVTSLDGETAYMTGVNVAGIFNDHYVLGFYNLDLENNVFSNNDNYIGSRMNFNHKGIWLGYIFMPKRMVHFTANIQAGKGYLEIYDDFANDWLEDDFIFVVTPSVEAEFNIARFLRVGVGANYRFTFDVDRFANYNDTDFSDLGAYVSFRFGWFN